MTLYDSQLLTFISLIVCLIAMYWLERNRSQSDALSLGLGKGIVALLGQWIGLYAFLASSQASYQYGIVGLIGYVTAGIFGYMFVYVWLGRERRSRPTMPSPILFLYRLEGTLVTVLAGKMVLQLVYDVSAHVSLAIVLVFLWVILIVRFGKRDRASFVIVILSITATVLLPTLVYLKVSVPTVYSGVKFLATEMLLLDNPASWILTAALAVRFVAHGLVNPELALIYRQVKASKRGLAFSLAPLIWAFLPLSIGTLSFVAKAEAVWPQWPDEVSILIVGHFGGRLGIVLLTVTLLLILLATMSRNMTEGTESLKSMELLGRAAMILLAGLITLLFSTLTILDTMLGFALIWAAVAPAVFWGQDLRSGGGIIATFAGLGTGITYTLDGSLTIGVIAAAVVSLAIVTPISIFQKREKGGFLA
jgi:urea-proton symporter